MHDGPGSRATRPVALRLGILVLVALSALAGAAASSLIARRDRPADAHDSASADEPRVRSERLECLTEDALASVRVAPQSIVDLYGSCREDLRAALGAAAADLDERDLQYAFCAVTAHCLAPYGPGAVAAPESLLHEATLNCATYGVLSEWLARQFPGAERDGRRMAYVGFDGGAAGNHQMLFLTAAHEGGGLLLDPTIGVIARTDFDSVLLGRPVAADRIVVLGHREDVATFRRTIVASLAAGRFKPSDLLYYFESMEHFLHSYGTPHEWPTPAAVGWRERHPRGSS